MLVAVFLFLCTHQALASKSVAFSIETYDDPHCEGEVTNSTTDAFSLDEYSCYKYADDSPLPLIRMTNQGRPVSSFRVQGCSIMAFEADNCKGKSDGIDWVKLEFSKFKNSCLRIPTAPGVVKSLRLTCPASTLSMLTLPLALLLTWFHAY